MSWTASRNSSPLSCKARKPKKPSRLSCSDANPISRISNGTAKAMSVLRLNLLISIACLLSYAANAQDAAATSEAPQVLRVNVRLVMVDAQVLTRKTGRAISSLHAEDFQVYEDGVQQPITSFSQDELPLSVGFLFDLTDSVRPVLKSLAGGALQALKRLKPEDEVAVMVYAASTQLLQDFTTDRELAAKAIEKASK